ncbi:unnamed protein product [Oppiella nova]|uniref:Cytochrome c oxidase subunit n=1 Tax=Oppiella nova TaxID=334625 RepID=A0A7R9M3J3_9ACAR|nr:unnamed protein product [Oppiella nova]CAG2170055.1 unnamed protein product [Oppiella nova]
MSEKIELKTAPYDPRFPNQNQTRNCYQNYLDYHRCQKVKGDKYEPCQWFKWAYTELCPKAWVYREMGRSERQRYLCWKNMSHSCSEYHFQHKNPLLYFHLL